MAQESQSTYIDTNTTEFIVNMTEDNSDIVKTSEIDLLSSSTEEEYNLTTIIISETTKISEESSSDLTQIISDHSTIEITEELTTTGNIFYK